MPADLGRAELEGQLGAEQRRKASGWVDFPKHRPFEHDQSAGHGLGSDAASVRNAPDPARKLHRQSTGHRDDDGRDPHGEAYSRHEDRQPAEYDLTPQIESESVEQFGEDRCDAGAIRTKRTSTSSERRPTGKLVVDVLVQQGEPEDIDRSGGNPTTRSSARRSTESTPTRQRAGRRPRLRAQAGRPGPG